MKAQQPETEPLGVKVTYLDSTGRSYTCYGYGDTPLEACADADRALAKAFGKLAEDFEQTDWVPV